MHRVHETQPDGRLPLRPMRRMHATPRYSGLMLDLMHPMHRERTPGANA